MMMDDTIPPPITTRSRVSCCCCCAAAILGILQLSNTVFMFLLPWSSSHNGSNHHGDGEQQQQITTMKVIVNLALSILWIALGITYMKQSTIQRMEVYLFCTAAILGFFQLLLLLSSSHNGGGGETEPPTLVIFANIVLPFCWILVGISYITILSTNCHKEINGGNNNRVQMLLQDNASYFLLVDRLVEDAIVPSQCENECFHGNVLMDVLVL